MTIRQLEAVPSDIDRAVEVTLDSLSLALVPVVGSLLSLSKVSRALATSGGGGMTFPFPTGLPTLWTYVALPSGPAGVPLDGPRSLVVAVPLLLLGLLFTSVLEAALLDSLVRRLDDRPIDVAESARRFAPRMVGVNLVRLSVVLVAVPFLVVPPLALGVVVVLSYLVYGLPFELVVRDVALGTALGSTVDRALDGGDYAKFGMAHLLLGGISSLFLTGLVRNAGVVGIVLGTAVVAVPAVVVAAVGLLVFGARGTSPG